MPDRTDTVADSVAIAARGVGVKIDATEILRKVSFRVPNGRLIGLLGPNGSGKTTLLRAVGGLLPFRGDIRILGRSVRAWKPRDLAQQLAFVRQSVSLSFDFNVSELVLLGRSPHKRWLRDYTAEDRTLLADALESVDLTGFEERSALSLSGGELQRVFLAQALAQEAGILLLDEPTAHLDVHYQFEFMELIRSLVESGRTAVAVFHDLELAGRFADELIVLHRGRLAASGSAVDVLTSELIASVFRMDAQVVREGDGHLHIRYRSPVERMRSLK